MIPATPISKNRMKNNMTMKPAYPSSILSYSVSNARIRLVNTRPTVLIILSGLRPTISIKNVLTKTVNQFTIPTIKVNARALSDQC